MNILIIGGTGVISNRVRILIEQQENEVTVINRGNKAASFSKRTRHIKADINDLEQVKAAIGDNYFDVVIDFLSFFPEDIYKRYEILKGKIGQFIFISSATVYKVKSGIVTENSPIGNEFSEYARNKIECESLLFDKLNGSDFPVTIIRPSHTYDYTCVPLGIHGNYGSWQNVKRIIEGRKVIIHDNGVGMWAMLRSEDFALQLYGILGKGEALGEVFQIASEESLSWERIYRIVADAVGMKLNACFISSDILAKEGKEFDLLSKLYGDKTRSLVFRNDKIKKIIGEYNPIFSMEEGIRDSVRSVMFNEELQRKDIPYDLWCDKMISLYG